MGKKLIIKGADFSENAIDVLIKQGYSDAISVQKAGWRYDSIPADTNVVIHKVKVTVPAATKLDKTKASSLWLAAYDGVNYTDGLSNLVKIDMTDVVNDIVDNNRDRSNITLTLPTPLAINVGEYFAFAPTNPLADETEDTNNLTICYKSNVDGALGYLMIVKNNSQTDGGTAIDWYGVEA
jgi:hypothetical protein